MIVLILTACPEGLRGHLTRWLMEVSAGVYVGHVSRRVREELWLRVISMIGGGRALLVYTTSGEQRLALKTFGHHWEPVDFEGITLMRKPDGDHHMADVTAAGWSTASRRRKYGHGRPSK